MQPQRVSFLLLVLLIMGSPLSTHGAQRERTTAPQQQPTAQQGPELRLTGEVVEIHGPRLFAMRERGGSEREFLVVAPRALSPGFVGATVTVEGMLRRFSESELRRALGLGDLDPQTRERIAGRTVLLATSVMAIARGEPRPTVETPPPAPRVEPPRQIQPSRVVQEEPLTVRTAMLTANVDVFAGRQVRLLHGRVVGVLEPGAFLIEPATPYLKAMGQRDRVLVLTGPATLRATPQLIVGSIVTVTGVARTLVGIQVTREAAWPTRLSPEAVEKLEVRAAVLATSVKTADGVELTDRQAAAVR